MRNHRAGKTFEEGFQSNIKSFCIHRSLFIDYRGFLRPYKFCLDDLKALSSYLSYDNRNTVCFKRSS